VPGGGGGGGAPAVWGGRGRPAAPPPPLSHPVAATVAWDKRRRQAYEQVTDTSNRHLVSGARRLLRASGRTGRKQCAIKTHRISEGLVPRRSEPVIAPRRPALVVGRRLVFPRRADQTVPFQTAERGIDGAARQPRLIDHVEAVVIAVGNG